MTGLSLSWKRLSERFNALPRRERTLLPAAVGFGLLALGYLLLIDPARQQLQQVQQQYTQEQTDLTVAQAQVKALKEKLQNPNAALRAQLDGLRTRTQSADNEFQQLEQSLVPAHDMSQWLSHLLQAQPGLQLTGLRSLPVASVSDIVAAKSAAPGHASATSATSATPTASSMLAAFSPAPPSAAASAPAEEAAAAADAWLYRHGLEITLRGNYGDLLSYLQKLEQLPRRVYWGELKMDAQDSPDVTTTLKIYTISLERTWWSI